MRLDNGLFFIDDHFVCPVDKLDIVTQVILVSAVFCHTIMYLSRGDSTFILGVLRLVAQTVLSAAGFSPKDNVLSKHIPKTMGAALSKFNLDGKVTIHAICTKCHSTYPPSFSIGSSAPVYPSSCSNKKFPSSDACGEALIRVNMVDGKAIETVVKSYVTHDLKEFLAGLLARKDIALKVNSACDELVERLSEVPSGPVGDVFEGDYVRKLLGPDGAPFVKRNGEVRILLALHSDSFNINMNLFGGASNSTTLISLAVLNLPSTIRYRRENLLVYGLIPGPKQPSGTEFNHYIRPLVDELCEFWDPGVKYSRTAISKNCVVRCAVALAACDLPAARKLAALAGTSANFFCSIHDIHGKKHMGETDFRGWKSRDNSVLRLQAYKWKNAPQENIREHIFGQHGVRWTEMWRLPYWNPTVQLVPDPMHCLLEGLCEDHFRFTIKLTSAEAKSQKPADKANAFEYNWIGHPDPLSKDGKEVTSMHAALMESIDRDDSAECYAALYRKLHRKRLDSLKFVCVSIPILVQSEYNKAPSKAKYVEALIKWVR